MKKGNKSEAANLRQKAEEQMIKQQSKVSSLSSENNLRKLPHELQVHQIELEMQYERLKQAKEESDAATQKYTELYDFATSGYFTLTKPGEIIELNFHGARLLGKERLHLINRRFGSSVSDQTKPIFNNFLDKVFTSKGDQSCEVTLSVESKNIPTYVYLTGHALENGEQCLISVVDITERKKAEEALSQSEENFRRSISESILGIRIVSVDGETIYANEAFLDIFEYNSLEEFRSTPAINRYTPESYAQHQIRKEKRKNGHDIFDYEISIIGKNAEIRHVKVSRKEVLWNGNKHYQVINLDITERKKAEDLLRKSENQYKSLVEKGNIGIGIDDSDGNLIYYNKQFLNLFGYSAEEVKNKSHQLFIHPDDYERISEIHKRRFLGQETPSRYEFKGIRKDGSVIFIELDVSEVYEENGKVSGTLSYLWDITERKQIELALKESESSLKSAQEIAKMGDWEFDFIKQKTRWSENTYVIYGLQPFEIEITDEYFRSRIHPYDLRLVDEGFKSLIKNKKPITFEMRIIFPDGSIKWIQNDIVPFLNKDQIVLLKGTNIDITDRKKMRDTQGILINISNAVISTNNLATFSQLIFAEFKKIIDTNNFYIALYNEETQMISTPYIADSLDEDITEFAAEKTLTGYVIKTKKSHLIDKEGFAELTKRGEVKLIGPPSDVWIGVPLFIDDKVIGAIVIQNYEGEKKLNEADLKVLEYAAPQISLAIERKRVFEDMKAALEKAEAGDRLKTAFMNNISHEIRTPLNAILGFAPFVIQPDIEQEDKEQFLNMLYSSSERLMNTVTNYMDISLLVSDNIKIFPKQVDISLLLKEIFGHFQKTCTAKNLAFKMDLPEPSDQFILNTDKELVQKIVTHLVDNAVKFTTTGSIELGYVLKTESGNTEIELFIKDTGQGISPDAHKRIFDAFIQEDISNTRGHEGSGLGLSIAKGLTQLLGGKMRLESEKNKGTTVFVTFPVEKLIPSEQTKVVRTYFKGEKFGTILVAEDDEMNYLYIETMLKGSFGKILKAENGQEAVDLCHKHPEIDLVLMDIKMPVMNGIEATRLIKSFRNDLPIIAVTAFAQSGDEHRFLEAGCDDYISKPFEARKLIKLVNKYLTI